MLNQRNKHKFINSTLKTILSSSFNHTDIIPMAKKNSDMIPPSKKKE